MIWDVGQDGAWHEMGHWVCNVAIECGIVWCVAWDLVTVTGVEGDVQRCVDWGVEWGIARGMGVAGHVLPPSNFHGGVAP